ncbi:MAG: type II toxin-antitoxin system HicB family antitoxin [Thermoleophilaceae bacterium]
MPEELQITVRLDEGALWATVEELPGVFATGDTLDELRESLEEGIALYVAEPGQPAPRVRLDELEAPSVVTRSRAHLAPA